MRTSANPIRAETADAVATCSRDTSASARPTTADTTARDVSAFVPERAMTMTTNAAFHFWKLNWKPKQYKLWNMQMERTHSI